MTKRFGKLTLRVPEMDRIEVTSRGRAVEVKVNSILIGMLIRHALETKVNLSEGRNSEDSFRIHPHKH